MNLKSIKIILVEGQHEKIIIDHISLGRTDGIKLKPEFNNVEICVIKAGQIEYEFKDCVEGFDHIIFVHDTDVEPVNIKVENVMTMASRFDVEFTSMAQQPFMETFLCSFFEDFSIDNKWDIDELKLASKLFLSKKMGIDLQDTRSAKRMKKITISDVIKAGGSLSNINGREEEFGILMLFEVKNV